MENFTISPRREAAHKMAASLSLSLSLTLIPLNESSAFKHQLEAKA